MEGRWASRPRVVTHCLKPHNLSLFYYTTSPAKFPIPHLNITPNQLCLNICMVWTNPNLWQQILHQLRNGLISTSSFYEFLFLKYYYYDVRFIFKCIHFLFVRVLILKKWGEMKRRDEFCLRNKLFFSNLCVLIVSFSHPTIVHILYQSYLAQIPILRA